MKFAIGITLAPFAGFTAGYLFGWTGVIIIAVVSAGAILALSDDF